MKSIIEQELIDGVFYWDSIQENWWRLIHRQSMDVVGSYRKCLWSTFQEQWNVSLKTQGDFVAPAIQFSCTNENDARAKVEQNAMQWIGAK